MNKKGKDGVNLQWNDMILVAHNFFQASAVLNGTQLFLGAAEPNNIMISESLSFEKYT